MAAIADKAGGAFLFFFQVCRNFDTRTEPRLLLTVSIWQGRIKSYDLPS